MAMTASSPVGVVVSAVLLLLLADVSFSHATFDDHRVLSFDGEAARSMVASWRRSIVESPLPNASSSNPGNSSLALAASRTYRSDPLTNFTMYTGGWNISDQHYWASVAFTAIPFFIIAALWLVGFGVVLIIICCCCCCCFCRGKSGSYSPASYFTTLILLIILIFASFVGYAVLERGQEFFHLSTINTVDYIFRQGNLTVDKLTNFAGSLAAAKGIGVHQIFLPADVQLKIDDIEVKINSTANEFSARMAQNSGKFKNAVDQIQNDLMTIGTIMFGIAVLGFLFSVLGLQFLVYLMVIAGWIILTVTISLGGGFILLHNVVSDTCMAMDEWVARPQAHTALDDILPCMNMATANESMYRSQEVTAQLVALVNNYIVNISNREFPPALKPLYFNQSGPLMPELCNPFNPNMTKRQCAPGEVTFMTAPGSWEKFECQVTGPPGSETCVTEGRLTPPAYDQLKAATSVSMGLYQFGPFLTQLQDCTFVRETFMDINRNYCPGLERYSRLVYIGLLLISAAVMLSIILWMLHTRQCRRRARRRSM